MTKVKNTAIDAFKNQVDLMAEYLKAAGYDIKRTHLIEAGARFQGARDWRTLRAGLELSTGGTSAKVVPQIGDKSVTVYMPVHACSMYGESPMFCFTTINQAWINRIYDAWAYCEKSNSSFIDDSCEAPEWSGNNSYRIENDGIRIAPNEFWYTGIPKHAEYRVETPIFDTEKLIQAIQATMSNELYLFSTIEELDDLMESLGRDVPDADFVSKDDPKIQELMPFLAY